MNITPIRRPTLAQLIRLPAGLPCIHLHWRRRDHASGTPRTSFTDGEVVTGSRRDGASNIDLTLRVRLTWLKSP